MQSHGQELAPLQETPALSRARNQAAQGPRCARGERRVLVVEDNPDSAESLRCLLALCGFEVVVAHTSQQGLEAARKLQPHVVLCDIGLPDCDGYSVGSVLRQSAETMRARLIAVTGHGAPQDRRRALAAGFDQHLVKPVDPRVLLGEMDAPH